MTARQAGLFRTRNVVVLILLIGAALAAAGVGGSGAARLRVLQLAEKLGLYQEAAHELEPVREQPPAPAASAPPAGHAGHGASAPQPQPETQSVEPTGLFNISPQRQQLIGVRFTEVARRPFTKTIRTVGRVELDERRIAQIHSKVSGWIEETFISFHGQHVEQGEPLFTLYSPELVSAQEEYLLALRAEEHLGQESNPFPQAARGARSLAAAAKARLQLWDVTPEQIAELERSREARRTLTVYSPRSGHVVERKAFPQMRITPDMTLYTIADHTNLWVYADLYEQEIGLVQVGQQAAMTVTAYPGEVFQGRVSYILPHLAAETRTLQARLEFPNPDLRLKPGMYAEVKLEAPLGTRLVVPKNAVLRTGKRDLVFVDRGAGQMEVRGVRLGLEVEDFYEVLAGLRAGERVVSAANFLVDAESQVQGAVGTWQVQEGSTPPELSRPPAATPPGLTAEILEPAQAQAGRNTFRLLIKDASGTPVENAEVEVTLFMPAMPGMAPMSASAMLRAVGRGQYSGTIDIPMAFTWQTTVTVRKEGRAIGTVRTTLQAR